SQGNVQDALKDYNTAILTDPDNDDFYVNRAKAHFALGNKQQACTDWKTAQKMGNKVAQAQSNRYCQ
ncbi:MAG: tetratricopeptide repeat protein, partial [Chitinophagales bacterium]|nr:tetratricopeptide repeat protein [Chitinophagales bacterium]